MKKSILILCDSDLAREPRVIRQIIALKDTYNITTAGARPSSFDWITHISFNDEYEQPKHWSYPMPLRKLYSAAEKLKPILKAIAPSVYFEKAYWTKRQGQMLETLRSQKFDLVFAHHWDMLPIAIKLKEQTHCKVIFNVHDYYQRQFETNAQWVKGTQPMVRFVMDTYTSRVDLVFAAWEKIAVDFSAKYKVPVVIIGNQTEFKQLNPVENTGNKISIVHHGIANANRQLELMFEVMEHLDERYELNLMLMHNKYNKPYYDMLKARGDKDGRINFIDPVDTRNIPERINHFDIGLFLLPPTDFNTTYLVPNKLYEFIQARLVCAVSPNVEMKKVVEKYELGIVTDNYDPATMAAKIKALSREDIRQFKKNADVAATKLSAEHTYTLINDAVSKLMVQ